MACPTNWPTVPVATPVSRNSSSSRVSRPPVRPRQPGTRRTQAILPIRGKILNVEKARLAKALQNAEVQDIITAVGTGIGDDFDIEKARYHKIVLLADADVDGAHIKTLLLTLLFRHLRPLIEVGYVYIAQPPLYRVKVGSKVHYLKDEMELDEFQKEHPKVKPTRFKGLGEMNPRELWETTMNPETRTLLRVEMADAARAEEIFETLMGDDVQSRKTLHSAERRRREVPGHMTDEQRAMGSAPEIEITSEMEASFIDYAMTVIVSRALPDVRDGLKPVQRRIIYSMFENNIQSHIRTPEMRQGRW